MVLLYNRKNGEAETKKHGLWGRLNIYMCSIETDRERRIDFTRHWPCKDNRAQSVNLRGGKAGTYITLTDDKNGVVSSSKSGYYIWIKKDFSHDEQIPNLHDWYESEYALGHVMHKEADLTGKISAVRVERSKC